MPESGPTPAQRERRIRLKTVVAVYDGKRSHVAQVLNLSEGGAFIAVKPVIPFGTGVSFWLAFGDDRVLIRGYVRWTRSLEGSNGEPVGCGLEFYDPDGALQPALLPLIQGGAPRG